MTLPWMRLFTRDWLDSKELRRCSVTARAVLIDLMCLAHEGEPYGYLADKVGGLATAYLASRCIVSAATFAKAFEELLKFDRVRVSEAGIPYIPRMVSDEELRRKRAAGGSSGGNPKLTAKVNLTDNLPTNIEDNREVNASSRAARVRADSVSVSDSSSDFFPKPNARAKPEAMAIPDSFEEWLRPWPRCPSPDAAARAWISAVSAADIEAVFACRDRYLASDEVARGAIMDVAKWLFAQAEAKWAGRWPTASSRERRGHTQRQLPPPATEERKMEAMQWLADNDPDPAARREAEKALGRKTA